MKFKLRIYRLEPQTFKGNKTTGYLETYLVEAGATIHIPDIIEKVAQKHGGGDYQIKLVNEIGNYIKSKKIKISGLPKWPTDLDKAEILQESEIVEEIKKCPTCEHEIKGIMNYPQVIVNSIKEEVVFAYSVWGWDPDEMASKLSAIVSQVLQLKEVQSYFNIFKSLVGKMISPIDIKPPYVIMEGNNLFWCEGHCFHLKIQDVKEGICNIVILTDGPNLGSAGGPTLSTLASLATIHYVGKLN